MNKLFASLLLVFATTPLAAQQLVNVPKLVVGITIDQLRTDYLLMMQNAFGSSGFRRLMNEGILYENAKFDYPNLNCASAVATIFTGTNPCYHGIVSGTVFNTERSKEESIFYDLEKPGNFTDDFVSPKALLTSTICDELKVASGGKSDVYAVAPSLEQAIISAGHAANTVLWIDNTTGNWASTTHYKEMPWYVEQDNQQTPLSKRIDTMVWEPLLPIQQYHYIPYAPSPEMTFRHDFSKSKGKQFIDLKSSGLVNREVTRMVALLFDHVQFGLKEVPDFLSVGYSASNYQYKDLQEYSTEVQDTYLRLDAEIARLLDLIDRKVGLNNVLIFVSSTGHFDGEGKEVSSFGVPAGEFFPKRAVSLLNMYLMAIYGEQRWVEGYHNGQLFLNRKAISDKLIDIEEFQTKAAEFLVQMAGVQDVVTSHQLMHGKWNDRVEAMRNGFHRDFSGDLWLEIRPGWEIVHEDMNGTREYIRNNAIPAPVIFFGRNIKPERITRQIKATSIAPTVSSILRIRSPNAASEEILPEFWR